VFDPLPPVRDAALPELLPLADRWARARYAELLLLLLVLAAEVPALRVGQVLSRLRAELA
jgi:hypothetical protein